MPRVDEPDTTRPPISPAMLRRLVLRWNRRSASSNAGAHLRRRQGHSLEFREYRNWQRGDDVRAVDWRASARLPRRGDLLARRFEAEDRMTLAILVDNRPEMALPEDMPKLLYALWAAGALASLVHEKGDRVVIGRMFEGAAEASLTASGVNAGARVRKWTEAQWQSRSRTQAPAAAAFADLDAFFGPVEAAAAVIVISDLLFDDSEGRFARFATRAQTRRRSLSILQLDSLWHETSRLRAAREFRLVRGPGDEDGELGAFDEAVFQQGAAAVAAHLGMLRHRIARGGLDWPAEPVSWPLPPANTDQGAGIDALRTLFVGTFPRLPMLTGLSVGGRD